MKVSYDSKADAMYIYFSKSKKSTRTEEVGDDLLVDYAGRELIGIEVLDVSKKLPKNDLKNVTSIIPNAGANFSRVIPV